MDDNKDSVKGPNKNASIQVNIQNRSLQGLKSKIGYICGGGYSSLWFGNTREEMEKKMLVFNPVTFANYISELRAHLFDDQPLEDILVGVQKNHRNRRFVAMYLLQAPEIFHEYHQKRRELGLERMYSQVISCLLTRTEENPLKQDLVEYLGIRQTMIEGAIATEYEIREMDKDLKTYLAYQTRHGR